MFPDNDNPACTITVDQFPASNVTAVTATFTFSEAVVDFSLASVFFAPNGTGSAIGSLTVTNSSVYLVEILNGAKTGYVTIGLHDQVVSDNVGHVAAATNNTVKFSAFPHIKSFEIMEMSLVSGSQLSTTMCWPPLASTGHRLSISLRQCSSHSESQLRIHVCSTISFTKSGGF